MKNPLSRWITAGMLTVALALLAGCAGEDGKDGSQGLQGPPGPNTCTTACHTDQFSYAQFLLPIISDFDQSQHHQGQTYQRSTNPCSRCHTNEGYQDFVQNNHVGVVANSSPISCFTCHAPHTNMDFSLRKSGPTHLDVSGANYDRGNSNTCAMCHQARVPAPAVADTSALDSRWGPHHGPQANVYSGFGAYDYGQPFTVEHAHSTIASGCVGCHMAPTPSEALGGRHTFAISYAGSHGEPLINASGCASTGCHVGLTNADARIKVDEQGARFDTHMAEIKTLLMAKGYLADDGTVIAPGPHGAGSANDRKALFNYLLLDGDRSKGVHNPAYIDDILAKTKAELEGKAL